MTTAFDRIAELKSSEGPQAAIDLLIETLREEKNYHRVFRREIDGEPNCSHENVRKTSRHLAHWFKYRVTCRSFRYEW